MKLYPQYFIFFLILVVVSCTKKTTINSSRNDSVEKYLKLASIDTLPVETRKKHNHKAFSFIDLEKNDSVVRWYLGETALNYSILKDSLNYYKVSKIHFVNSSEAKDSLNLARFYRYLGSYYSYDKHQTDSALFFYNKAEWLYIKVKNEKELANVFLNKSYCCTDFSDYLASEVYLKKALNIFQKYKDYPKIRLALNELGNVKHNIRDYQEAIGCHQQALDILVKNEDKFEKNYFLESKMISYNNIGNSYRQQKDFKKALYYFNEEFKIINNHTKKETIAYLLNNIGYCYLKQNYFEKLPDLFEKAAKIFDSCGIKNEAAISRIYLAEYYAKVKDTSTAIHYADKAVELAKESKSSYYYLHTLSNAGTIDKQKAPQYIAEYHRLNDSLLFEERKARNQYFKSNLKRRNCPRKRKSH